ncbi:MAG: type II toxin-antitoxin system CcdA family antitoxin [Bradymonadia bacterium]
MTTPSMRIQNGRMRIAVNLSVSPDLVAAARARGFNLSRVLEQRLAELLGTPPSDPFAEENAEAVAAYNARVAAAGTFSDEHRSF